MAFYPSPASHHGGRRRPPPPYPPRVDAWMHQPPPSASPMTDEVWSPPAAGFGSGASRSVSSATASNSYNCDLDPEIYESIYDSRWRLLNQEAARIQREQTSTASWNPVSPAMFHHHHQQQPQPPGVVAAAASSAASSRESSLDPSSIVHTATTSILSSRSPRQIVIQRREEGFGFTLRHFIVYPPEDPSLDSSAGVDIKEPLDTIFVKSVREGGPAYLAGLQCGDRIISVNGESVSGKSYAEVVGLIQRLRDNLSLIVVPKQDDILQMYFSDIAQNPETNQRPLSTPPASRTSFNHGYASRETSPYSEFVNNGPTRLVMASPYRPPPDAALPPWAVPASTEHVYAVPARIIRTSEESVEAEAANPLQRDPRSVGSLVSLDSGLRPPARSSVMYEPPEAVANDPVINRIKRDVERKQEFLRTTNLPNYLASSDQIAQGEQQRPVFFGDRFPVHHPRDLEEPDSGSRGQFHLYGLQLGYRRSGRQFEDEEAYNLQQTQQQQQRLTTVQLHQQALSHHHHHQQLQHHQLAHHRSPNTYQPHFNNNNNAHYDGSNSRSSSNVVLRRKKKQQQSNLDDEEERNLRRVSYLRATKEDRMHVDSDNEDQHEHAHPSTPKNSTVEGGEGTPRHAPSIQRIRALFGERAEFEQQQAFQHLQSHSSEVLCEGWLHCKVTAVEGKKSVDRSWRNVYVVLTCDSLNAYKDKKLAASTEPPSHSSSNFEEWPQIVLSESGIEIAEDYTKKKHVFRLRTEAGSEALFQADNEAGLQHWVQSVEAVVGIKASSTHQQRKLTSAAATPSSHRNRSPTGQSPATKNRKPSADQGPMNKESSKKTWKGKVAKQWKRMQGSTPAQNTSYPEGGSIGVPLEECPMSDLECVPLLVRTCCRIVEEKGLDIVGIYRVPGNAAAVNMLTEQVNTRGEEVFVKQDDPKWNDVNIVTSLLKSFFRKLPDPIFTMEMYGVFIEASKIEDANRRLNALRKLIRELPEVNFDTLHHICGHLVKVMERCETNKMEIRNLAIVFGPTLVRPADDNMLSMVTDMSHQCRIIESILSNFEWFFNEDEDLEEGNDTTDLEAMSSPGQNNMDLIKLMDSSQEHSNHGLLLSNLQKLEDSGKISTSSGKDVSAKDIVSGIISAANRKMLRSQNKTSSSSGSNNTKKDSMEKKLDSSALAASRRNSESVFQGAVAIAAAVPQLMVNAGNSMSTSNLATSTASQENLINVESTMMSSSTSRIVSTVGYDESGFKEDSNGKKVKYPIETYQGLEKATAERVRRFVDETRANLMRGRPDSSPNLNRTTTDGHVENWTDDLAGGILFQDDPYPPHAFNERLQAQDRFVNLTYRSPSMTKPSDRMMRPPMLYRPGVLTRGLSLGELTAANSPHHHQPLTPFEFDTNKVTSHDTLKRLKLVKSPTDTQLFVPNQLPTLIPTPEPSTTSDSMLTSLTADFDEKMKILLDPNYSGGSQSDTSSVQSTPSKVANFRRVSEINPKQATTGKNCRSISLGEDSHKVCNAKQLSILSEQQKNSKKSELKRGRLVDKHHQPKLRPPSDEMEAVAAAGENLEATSSSSSRLKAKNRRLRRRHTVGGTQDFADLDLDNAAVESEPEQRNHDDHAATVAEVEAFDPASYHQSVMMNVNRSLGQWIMRQKKMGKSSPDLSLIGRRLSLPDSVLATSAAFYPFTSLLESQV